MNLTIEWILDNCRGRKTTIGLCLALFNTYFLTIGLYGNNEAVLTNGLLLALGLTANLSDAKLLTTRNEQTEINR